MSKNEASSNSCAALKLYVERRCDEASRYSKGTTRAYVYWISAQAISLLAGFLGAIISLTISTSTSSRIVIAVLSSLASLAGTVMTQLRLYELWNLRESFKPSFQSLAEDGRRQVASCADNDKACDAVYASLIEKWKLLNERENVAWSKIRGKTSIASFVNHIR